MTIYAYARVSTLDQHLERQLQAFKDAGYNLADKNIFKDKQSGKDMNRPGVQELLQRLKPGDTLVIQDLDRLGRCDEVEEVYFNALIKHKINFVCLECDLLNLVHPLDDLELAMKKAFFLFMNFMAKKEREKIQYRQQQGIRVARAKGVKFGRPSVAYDMQQLNNVYDKYISGALKVNECCKLLGVGRTSFYKLIKEKELKLNADLSN